MITVQIADDHTMFRQGLAAILNDVEDIQITGQANDGFEILSLLNISPPDILLLDIEMPNMDGFQTLKELKKLKLKTKVLVLTMHKSSAYIKNIIKAGASGYLQKDAGKEILVEAIRKTSSEGRFFTSETAAVLLESLQNTKSNSPISKREKEVVSLIVDGLTTKEIADQLYLSKHTIESHRQNILLKLGLKNSAELVRYAVERGIV